jgi:hypothetical protein
MLEPLAFWNVGLRVEPLGEEPQLVRGDTALLDTIQKMFEQGRGQVVATDPRHQFSRRRTRAGLHLGVWPSRLDQWT